MSESFWEEEARRYAINTDYWKDRTLKAEARIAELEFWVRKLQGFMDDCPLREGASDTRRPEGWL